jgi:hydroxymethylpyrimidine pyrophosphatase-like HAD family hydrolase
MNDKLYISCDFDGTITTHEYPEIGSPVPYALETLRELNGLGHKIILLTMRGHRPVIQKIKNESGEIIEIKRDCLQEAIDYLTENGVKLYAVNENPTQKFWTDSKKCYSNLYVDDAAYGAPLIQPENGRPYLNWLKLRKMFNI